MNSTLDGIEQLQFMTFRNVWISQLRHNKKLVEHGLMSKIISSLSILAYCGIMQLFEVIPQTLIQKCGVNQTTIALNELKWTKQQLHLVSLNEHLLMFSKPQGLSNFNYMLACFACIYTFGKKITLNRRIIFKFLNFVKLQP